MKKVTGIRGLLRYNAVLLALFLVVCTGGILYILYRINQAGLERQIGLISESVAGDVDYKLLNITRFSTHIFLDSEFQEATTHLDDADNQRYYEKISDIFSQMVIFSSLVVDVYYWPFDEAGELQFENYIIQGRTAEFMMYNQQAFEEFAENPANARGKLGIVTDNGAGFMAFTRVTTGILPENYLRPIGLGAVVVNVSRLFDRVNDIDVTGARAGITDGQYNGVFRGSISSMAAGEQFIVKDRAIVYPLGHFDWQIVSVYTVQTVFSSFGSAVIAFIVEMALLMLLFSLCMLLFIYFNSKQYYLFQDTFRKIEAGNLQMKMPYGKDPEVNKVAERFNSMMDAINQLNRQVLDAEVSSLRLRLEKNNYLLKYLNSQINKHFVFNTFGLIRAFVNIGETKKAASCIDSMCDVMRYTLRTKDVVRLREELESLSSYLNIQALRCPGIDVRMEIDEDCTEEYIPKFILQPIVENCYAHGFEEGKGHIFIRVGHSGEFLKIVVQDDGRGVSQEELRRLRENLSEKGESVGSDGIALRNIARRLQIVSSVTGTLTLDSETGRGFTVTIEVKLDNGESMNV